MAKKADDDLHTHWFCRKCDTRIVTHLPASAVKHPCPPGQNLDFRMMKPEKQEAK